MPKGKATATRIRIVDSAVSLYKSRGYQSVTVHDICAASGLTRSAFYYHFNSKDEILDDYYLSTDRQVLERLMPMLSTRSYVEQMYTLFHMYLQRTLDAGPSVLGQMLKRSMDSGVLFSVIKDQNVHKMLVSLVEQAQGAGQIRNPTPAAQLVDTALHLTCGLVLSWCSRQGKWDVMNGFHRIMSTLFLNGPSGLSGTMQQRQRI